MELELFDSRERIAYARQRMAEFSERCRAGGLAVTPQRLAIIEALLASTDHPRAEVIFDKVRRRHPHISLATVHRTLETLCAIGEARKVTMLYDSARYDGNLDPHHHIVCVECRSIRDVAISGAERPGLQRLVDGSLALEGFTAIGWSLEVQAVCDQCKAGSVGGDRNSRRRPKAMREGRILKSNATGKNNGEG
ncbi:MAG TPA: transcriptional repressor [Candidatus Binataceae bacterium]|nr:transcriptional repressor [Candidatus Binataceae bacterium]